MCIHQLAAAASYMSCGMFFFLNKLKFDFSSSLASSNSRENAGPNNSSTRAQDELEYYTRTIYTTVVLLGRIINVQAVRQSGALRSSSSSVLIPTRFLFSFLVNIPLGYIDKPELWLAAALKAV